MDRWIDRERREGGEGEREEPAVLWKTARELGFLLKPGSIDLLKARERRGRKLSSRLR
jgi:hypothetical protein